MKFLTVLSLLSAATLVAAAPIDDPQTFEDPISVVGGEPVGTNEKYPWMVSLQRQPVGSGKSFCGGSLIAPNAILTAAHCTQSWGSAKGYAATSRRYDITKPSAAEGGIDFDVLEWFVHPNYTRAGSAPINDVAVWIVKVNKNHAEKKVAYTKFANDPSIPVAPENITVIGWGAIRESGPQSNVLLETTIPTIDLPTCQKLYNRNPGAIVDSVVCAGFADGGKDTCQGDSGGPLFTLDAQGVPVLQGITSWGEGCARKGKPGIYTRVGAFSSWVQSVLDKFQPTEAELAASEVVAAQVPAAPATETEEEFTISDKYFW